MRQAGHSTQIKLLIAVLGCLGWRMVVGETLGDGRQAYLRRDYAKAMRILLPQAQQGIAKAQILVGRMHLDNAGVKIDVGQALMWFQAAAMQGDGEGQVAYAHMFHNGQGTKRDFAQALRWYNEAALQGDAEAAYELANMYAAGEGTRQDFTVATRWYHAAAEKKHASAMFRLGVAHAEGRGIVRDYINAYVYLKLAEKFGVAKARAALNVVTPNLTKKDLATAKQRIQLWLNGHPA
ncbi:MAG: tetratricopeptide repeat protein [Pseudomonadota bacterium]